MAAWPELDELKQVLNVESTDWDGDDENTRLTRLLGAAIAQTKADIGLVDDDFEPSDAQAQAALRMAELLAVRPGELASAAKDPTYRLLLKGSRRVFGIA